MASGQVNWRVDLRVTCARDGFTTVKLNLINKFATMKLKLIGDGLSCHSQHKFGTEKSAYIHGNAIMLHK